MPHQPDNSIFGRQDTLPKKVARNLDYGTGFALGVAVGHGGDGGLGDLLEAARVLSEEHGSVRAAARVMDVAEDGLRGFLAGAEWHPDAAPVALIGLAPAPSLTIAGEDTIWGYAVAG